MMLYSFPSDTMEEVTECMHRIYSSPDKPQDVLTSKMFAARNIKPIAGRSCALVSGTLFWHYCLQTFIFTHIHLTKFLIGHFTFYARLESKNWLYKIHFSINKRRLCMLRAKCL